MRNWKREVAMKSVTTRRFRYLVLVLVVGGFLGWILFHHTVASTAELAQVIKMKKPPQQRTIKQIQVLPLLPASGKESPEFTMVKQVKVPPQARPQPTTRELLNKISKRPGGKEKVAAARSGRVAKKILPASGKEPPEFARIKQVKAPSKVRLQPTTRELLNKVRLLPGGEQKIQRLKQVRPNISMGLDEKGSALSWLTNLNPFRPKEAHAETDSLTLTTQKLYSYTPFYGKIEFWGTVYGYKNYKNYAIMHQYTTLKLSQSTAGLLRQMSRSLRPFVKLKVKIPSTGYYVVNFETFRGAQAYLMHRVGDTYTAEEKWDTRSDKPSLYVDHPALLHLSAGEHSLYFVLEQGTTWFYRATVKKL